MIEQDNDDVGLIIDRALRSYVPEYEPLGLHQRVLSRIHENARSRQRKLPFFVLAFASLCIALIALVAIPGSRSLRGRSTTKAPVPPVAINAERHESKAALSAHEYRQGKASVPMPARRRLPSVSSGSEHRHSLPKLDQFPAPAPLTNEERALLQLSAGSAGHLFASEGNSNIDPIHIEPLRINPL